MAGITDDDLLVFWVRLCDDMIFLLIWCDPIKKIQLLEEVMRASATLPLSGTIVRLPLLPINLAFLHLSNYEILITVH